MIRERQTSEKVERYDLLSSLLEANNDDGEEVKLTESELRGERCGFYLHELNCLSKLNRRKHFHLSPGWT